MNIKFNLAIESVNRASPVEPLCVDPDSPLRHVFDVLRQQRSGSVLVCQDGVLVGIFTERDALRVMATGQSLDTPVRQAMTPDPVTIRPEAKMGQVIRDMASRGYRRLPIVDEQHRPLGVVQVPGLLRFLVEHFPRTIYNLPPVPNQALQEREGP